jgi:adenylate cyclase
LRGWYNHVCRLLVTSARQVPAPPARAVFLRRLTLVPNTKLAVAELIAQGAEPHQRWRRTLRAGQRFVLGRETFPFAVGWDQHISRQHAALHWSNGHLAVERLPDARNHIFVGGAARDRFSLAAGEYFVIGQTTFTVSSDTVNWSADVRPPNDEQTFSAESLHRVRFRNADHRIEVLSRLPDVIAGAANETELFVRLVSMLLAGIPRASAVALVAVDEPPDAPAKVRVLQWDRRMDGGEPFRPSQRLILEAVRRGQSVLHVWEAEHADEMSRFTMSANIDWAFCTPVEGDACRGWGVYVAGSFAAPLPRTGPPPADDLREELKFTELVAATLASLRRNQILERKQTALLSFFSPQVLEAISREDPEVALRPRETEVSVLFCDLRGFSRETERHAGDLIALLDRVSKALGVMTHHILAQGGVFGDFQGDAAMGFWGWPIAPADAIERACAAALAIRQEFEAAGRQTNHPLADFRMGIGLATGRAVAGRIGTSDQSKVTVFGPVVNRASRLEGMTRILQTAILLDDATAQAVRAHVPAEVARCRRIAVVMPYGFDTPVEVSELLPPVGVYPDLTDEHIGAYEAALDAFISGNWTEAVEQLHLVPAKDRVKDFLMVYIAQCNRTPPPGWTGVVPLTRKG